MSGVTPYKLTPIVSSDPTTSEFQTVSTSEVAIKKQQNTPPSLTNLDSELLEILHNTTLSEDAKAKLYWIALHKSEIYKDKSMWSEPTIVELRENRFIPIPITTPIISRDSNKRKRGSEEILSNKRKKGEQSVSETTPLQITEENIADQPSRKRKNLSAKDESEKELKYMALVNRIQGGRISQEEIEQARENIESPQPTAIAESDIITGPLVVTGLQDEPQYVAQPSISKYTPKEFSISESLAKKLQPDWLTKFYNKMETKKLSNYQKSEIKNIIKNIMEVDPKFKLNDLSITTSMPAEINGDPIFLFSNLIGGNTSTRKVKLLKTYLQKLKVNYQGGDGFKNKIKKWVKL